MIPEYLECSIESLYIEIISKTNTEVLPFIRDTESMIAIRVFLIMDKKN